MDREERVKRAINLLKPRDKAAARRYLMWAINEIEETRRDNQHLKDLYSADARQALDDFHIALKNAAIRYKRLPDGIKQTIGILLVQRGHLSSAFDNVIKVTTSVRNERLRRQSKIDYVGLNAAAVAWNIFGLLGMAGPPLTNGGQWPQLAAILAGSDLNFFEHCRRYRKGIAAQSRRERA